MDRAERRVANSLNLIRFIPAEGFETMAIKILQDFIEANAAGLFKDWMGGVI